MVPIPVQHNTVHKKTVTPRFWTVLTIRLVKSEILFRKKFPSLQEEAGPKWFLIITTGAAVLAVRAIPPMPKFPVAPTTSDPAAYAEYKRQYEEYSNWYEKVSTYS